MSILQNPIKLIEQAEEYLFSSAPGKFPEAREIAAGNLCRQVLEQILFILCFYSRMGCRNFVRPDRSLMNAGKLLRELDRFDSKTGKNYWQLARESSPRIAKFGRKPATLRKWGRLLNEPSHFSLAFRRVSSGTLLKFVSFAKGLFDERDWHLITVAINELFSNGKYVAQIGNDPQHTPGILFRAVATAKNLTRESNGAISFRGPELSFMVIPADSIPRGRWPKLPVMIQGSNNIAIMVQLMNRNGNRIDMSSLKTLINTLADTEHQKRYVVSRLRRIGIPARVIRSSRK